MDIIKNLLKYVMIITISVISGVIAYFVYNQFLFPKTTYTTQATNVITNLDNFLLKASGSFELLKHDGTRYKLSSLQGKPTLIYFGFTHCPDFCPTSLQIMDAVAEKTDINRVFVSLDPDRDTQKILKEYVSLYKAGLIGLTGTSAEIDKVAKQWHVYYGYNKKSKTDQDYTVDHSTYIYLLDENTKVIALFRPEATVDEIYDFIKNYKK